MTNPLLPYIPLFTTAGALAGVIFTLVWNGRRERRNLRIARTDEYRRETRVAIAELLAAAAHFQTSATTMGHVSNWTGQGFERATALKDELERCRLELRTKVGIALLLVQADEIRDGVFDMDRHFRGACDGIHRLAEAFWGTSPEDIAPAERDTATALEAFAEAVFRVHERSIRCLRPTVFEEAVVR
ncbi:hypothetical protein [Spirilliplanes yamanashiensis]|uniref:hypothetical protein n=1 Tax=Spirilliplanes yamanashiensis TaxID=42233 RepID=UPI001951C8EE|nr:hypothetical protein [Spirilliplanes yamanashiensis]MDP9820066.1 hypothetical protein [Spirilliplanes yamanashiensis]